MFKKSLNEGQAGENVGLLLRGVKREDLLRGQVCEHGKNPRRFSSVFCHLLEDNKKQRRIRFFVTKTNVSSSPEFSCKHRDSVSLPTVAFRWTGSKTSFGGAIGAFLKHLAPGFGSSRPFDALRSETCSPTYFKTGPEVQESALVCVLLLV
jgi:hypothetical protein